MIIIDEAGDVSNPVLNAAFNKELKSLREVRRTLKEERAKIRGRIENRRA